jgi:type IV pilus assembly protein PilO
MTLSEEFISFEEDGDDRTPTYPTAFGVTFTPPIIGVVIAVLGLAGGVYLFLSLLIPAWQRNQELTTSQNQKQSLVEQQKASLKQTEKIQTELTRAKQQKVEVLALFANEKTLDTLLLDLNRLVQSTNVKQTSAKLKKFTPVNQTAEMISDGALGSEVNGKLKRRIVNIAFEGTFEQTQAILRNIERLQPLLIVKDYNSEMSTVSSNSKDNPVVGPPVINTSFQLQALIPASAEEVTQAAAAAGEKEKKK